MDYAGPIALIAVALIGALGSFVTQRNEHARALQEIEILERLNDLAVRQVNEWGYTGTFDRVAEASIQVRRRLRRWEDRGNRRISNLGLKWFFWSLVIGAIIQAVYISAFGADPGFPEAARSLLRSAWQNVVNLALPLGAFMFVLGVALELKDLIADTWKDRKAEKAKKEAVQAPEADVQAGPQDATDTYAI